VTSAQCTLLFNAPAGPSAVRVTVDATRARLTISVDPDAEPGTGRHALGPGTKSDEINRVLDRCGIVRSADLGSMLLRWWSAWQQRQLSDSDAIDELDALASWLNVRNDLESPNTVFWRDE